MVRLVAAATLAIAALAAASPVKTGTDPVSPDTYTVTMNTDLPADPITGSPADPIVISVNRSLAPIGADHFYALVKARFYDNSAFFRVVPKFVVQFGISGDKDLNDEWLHKSIKDDPVKGSNSVGTITYADAGPNTRSSQVFINYGDNSRLDAMGFAPFGTVTGMDSANALFNPTPTDAGGVDQGSYEEKGNTWIKATYPGINFITDASVNTASDATKVATL